MDNKLTVLITGAGPNGVTGRRLREQLEALNRYELLTPSSKELDLTDTDAVDKFFDLHKVDIVVHSALVAPSRGHDSSDENREVEDNLRMFFNLVKHSRKFNKMFYFGSGAEFDKRHDIVKIKEEEACERMPADKYGFIKHILNTYAENSDNVYNLRLFGTINPYEPAYHNVISNMCAKAAAGAALELRQDTVFSFVDIDDVVRFIDYGINNDLLHHAYNMSGGIYTISEIAALVSRCAQKEGGASFANPSLGREYTADNSRLLAELGKLTPIEVSVGKVYQKVSKDNIDLQRIDARWQNTTTQTHKS